MSLKRPYTSITLSEYLPDPEERAGHVRDTPAIAQFRQAKPAHRRSSKTVPRIPSMPSQTSSQSLLASIPSFMSVFGASSDMRGRKGSDATETNASNGTTTVQSDQLAPTNDFLSRIPRRGSSSTYKTDSTDSSPTTTISTFDSSLTDPSPSSSPESPTSVIPLGSFESLKASSTSPRDVAMDPPLSPLPNLPGFNRGDSPGRKRNTKNLSLNTSASHKPAAQTPRLAPSTIQNDNTPQPLHAPTSPSFIVPPKPPARRPSNMGLSLSTKDSSAQSLAAHGGLTLVPQTPYGPHPSALKDLHRASSLPLFSPTAAPEGGMQLPPFGNTSTTSRFVNSRPPLSLSQNPSHSYSSIYSSPLAVQTLDHVQEEVDYDPPLSREVKSPAYPQGPVCIYEPHVYLYLEPNIEEASQFEVVINVAREVKNPFDSNSGEVNASQAKDSAVPTHSDELAPMAITNHNIPEPLTAGSETSFQSAVEMQSEAATDATLMTPKAPKREPEYIHIPWEHNTNVVEELPGLCKLIDNRVQDGKRVLIHCQCGVSRSASLVVAYGLYKKPELTVQQAYDAVKDRSRWIGPNMNLIYQLSEFKTNLPRPFSPPPPARRSWRAFEQARSPSSSLSTPNSKSTLPSASLSNGHSEPLSAPLPYDQEPAPARANSLSPPTTAHLIESLGLGSVSPGPSSAPPDVYTGMRLDLPKEAKGTDEPATEQLVLNIFESNRTNAEPQEMHTSIHARAESSQSEMSPALTADTEAAQFIPSPSLGLETEAPPPSKLTEPKASRPIDLSIPGGHRTASLKRPLLRYLPLRDHSPPSEHPTIRAQYANRSIDHVMGDDCGVPETPSLLSPRAAEFTGSPFHRTAAGDLAGSSVFEQSSKLEKGIDPRSPATRGEAPIVRSIDDLL